MRRLLQVLPLLSLLTVSPRITAAETNEWFRPPDIRQFQSGRHVYRQHCVVCHGALGKGDGELVQNWEVLPRNFRRAGFKYRSTPYGKLPTDDDLRRTIRRGLANSAMPTFQHLRDRDVEAVINYLKTFSPKWRQPVNFAAPLEIPAAPDWLERAEAPEAKLARGREVFTQACAPCHGETGRGDGPAAAALTDSEGGAVHPADLTGVLGSGPEPGDTFRTIATGITGTPMAGFRDALNDEDIWAVVAYLKTLEPASESIEPGNVEPEPETGLPSVEVPVTVERIP